MVTILKNTLVVAFIAITSLAIGMIIGVWYINNYMVDGVSSCGLSPEQACDSLSAVLGE